MANGLISRFSLENGKFVLTDGIEKASNSVRFFCTFDKFRVYCSDYGARVVSLTQKPISYIFINRSLIIGSFKAGIQKYTKDVRILDIDFGYTIDNKKEVKMKVEFSAIKNGGSVGNGVIFV